MTTLPASTVEAIRLSERQLLEQLDAETDDDVVIDLTEAEPVVVVRSPRRAERPPAQPGDDDDAISHLIRVALAKALDER